MGMPPYGVLMKRILIVAACAALAACGGEVPPPPAPAVAPSAALAEHGKEFRKEVIEVADGIHVAIGYGLANSILLEGSDGFIVVDTMETVEEARALNAEFRRIDSVLPSCTPRNGPTPTLPSASPSSQ